MKTSLLPALSTVLLSSALLAASSVHSQNRSAHAHGDEGAYAAVKAGVRSIEHGTYLSDQPLALMKERGTYFVPTIATVLDLIDPGGDYDNAVLSIRGRHMLPRVREAASRAWKMGIKVIHTFSYSTL